MVTPAKAETCESCGDVSEPLIAVHRQYVTPAAWDTEAKVDVVAEVEQWCLICCTHYPHQVAED